MDSGHRLLLCKVNGLGDLVAFIPTILGIRRLLPDAQISVMVPQRHMSLVSATVPEVEVIGVEPEIFHEPRRHLLELAALALRLRRLGISIALSSHDERSSVPLLQMVAGIPIRFGFVGSCKFARLYNRPVLPAFHDSMLENDFQLVRQLAESIGQEAPRLLLPTPRFDRMPGAQPGQEHPAPQVLLHPTAKYLHKRWPWQSFRALVREVHKVRPEVRFVVLSDGEELQLEELPASVVRTDSTDGLCRLIAESDVVVANNSGPMNVTWMLDVPLILLSGPSPKYWSPPRSTRTIEFRDRAACAPCESPGHTPGRCLNAAAPMSCMQAISVAEVAAALLRLLETTSAEQRRLRLEQLGMRAR